MVRFFCCWSRDVSIKQIILVVGGTPDQYDRCVCLVVLWRFVYNGFGLKFSHSVKTTLSYFLTLYHFYLCIFSPVSSFKFDNFVICDKFFLDFIILKNNSTNHKKFRISNSINYSFYYVCCCLCKRRMLQRVYTSGKTGKFCCLLIFFFRWDNPRMSAHR